MLTLIHSTEQYQVNIRVGCIARPQVVMGGFVSETSPPPIPEASEDEDDNDDDGDASSSDTNEMST